MAGGSSAPTSSSAASTTIASAEPALSTGPARDALQSLPKGQRRHPSEAAVAITDGRLDGSTELAEVFGPREQIF
jgi:hypothetical protein